MRFFKNGLILLFTTAIALFFHNVLFDWLSYFLSFSSAVGGIFILCGFIIALISVISLPFYVLFYEKWNPFVRKRTLKNEVVVLASQTKQEHDFLNATKMYDRIRKTSISPLHLVSSNLRLLRREVELRKFEKQMLTALKNKKSV